MLGHARPAHAQQAESRGGDDDARTVQALVPAEVERIVRFDSLAFNQDQPFGGSLEASALIDSNISRATRSDSFGTVIADLPPSRGLVPGTGEDAAGSVDGGRGLGDGAISGLGLSLRGQAWLRRQVDNDSDFLVRLAGNGELYEDARYHDVALSLQAGPEIALGSDRLAVFAGPSWRWYAAEPYSLTLGGGVSWQHRLGRGAQLRLEGTAAHVNNRRDDLLDGGSFTFSAELDRALSPRAGLGARVLLVRETARDPGYANVVGAFELHGFRTLGATTLVATLGYARLEADRALAFFPDRRVDDCFSASLAATFRGLRLGPAAPLARLRWERNRSSVSFYDYRRVAAEIGLIAAF